MDSCSAQRPLVPVVSFPSATAMTYFHAWTIAAKFVEGGLEPLVSQQHFLGCALELPQET